MQASIMSKHIPKSTKPRYVIDKSLPPATIPHAQRTQTYGGV